MRTEELNFKTKNWRPQCNPFFFFRNRSLTTLKITILWIHVFRSHKQRSFKISPTIPSFLFSSSWSTLIVFLVSFPLILNVFWPMTEVGHLNVSRAWIVYHRSVVGGITWIGLVDLVSTHSSHTFLLVLFGYFFQHLLFSSEGCNIEIVFHHISFSSDIQFNSQILVWIFIYSYFFLKEWGKNCRWSFCFSSSLICFKSFQVWVKQSVCTVSKWRCQIAHITWL